MGSQKKWTQFTFDGLIVCINVCGVDPESLGSCEVRFVELGRVLCGFGVVKFRF